MAVGAKIYFGAKEQKNSLKTYDVVDYKLMFGRSYDNIVPEGVPRMQCLELTVSPGDDDKFFQKWFTDGYSEYTVLWTVLPGVKREEDCYITMEEAVCYSLNESFSPISSKKNAFQKQLKVGIMAPNVLIEDEATLKERMLKDNQVAARNEVPQNEEEYQKKKSTKKAYYQLGDIIKYKNRYYVCVSLHGYGETAHFVTFNDQETHKTKTYDYKAIKSLYGLCYDTVYSDSMASAETLAKWISNILYDDDMCELLRTRMKDANVSDFTKQIVPENKNIRSNLARHLSSDDIVITHALEVSNIAGAQDIHLASYEWQLVNDILGEKNNKTDFSRDKMPVSLFAPYGYMLADKSVAASGDPHMDHWVPYIFVIKSTKWLEYKRMLGEESQSTKNPDCFQAKELCTFTYNGSQLKTGEYHIVKMAIYWYHGVYEYQREHYMAPLIDFTKDIRNHPKTKKREQARSEKQKEWWTNVNITSRELTFDDNGKKKYESVYVESEYEYVFE